MDEMFTIITVFAIVYAITVIAGTIVEIFIGYDEKRPH